MEPNTQESKSGIAQTLCRYRGPAVKSFLLLCLAGVWGCQSEITKSRPVSLAPPEPTFMMAGIVPPKPAPPTNVVFSSRGMLLTFFWATNPEPDIVSYVIYCGLKPRQYSWSTNVGIPPITNFMVGGKKIYGPSFTIGPLSWRNGTIYAAATARNESGLESEKSNELTNVVPHLFWLTNTMETATNVNGPWVKVSGTVLTNDSAFQRYFRNKIDITDE